MKLHLYSDLNLRYLQHTEPVDEVVPPETDLIVVAGNISKDIKRSLLFQETLKSNQKPVVLNMGLLEAGPSVWYDTVNAMQVRYAVNSNIGCYYSPKGGMTVEGFDIMTYAGWHMLSTDEEYQNSYAKNVTLAIRKGPRYNKENQLIGYVQYNSPDSLDSYNSFVREELAQVTDWLDTDNGLPKLLVAGHAPESFLQGLDLTGLTICSVGEEYQDYEYQGARVICNPGSGAEARSRLFNI